MADWATISSLATAGGTLVLAAATFASVRSANRSARVSELALQEQRRPVLVHSRSDDGAQRIGFAEGNWVNVPGGGAALEATAGAAYLALSLRNVGAGLAVMQAWRAHSAAGVEPESETVWREGVVSVSGGPPPSLEDFRPLRRDQYIPGGDIGVWQGAVREPADPVHATLAAAIAERRPFLLDLLYTDQLGGQRTISRFGVLPDEDDENGWLTAAARHWYLDAPAAR